MFARAVVRKYMAAPDHTSSDSSKRTPPGTCAHAFEHPRPRRAALTSNDSHQTPLMCPFGLGTTLQAMHAAMSQAPLWCSGLADADQQRALDELTDTLMKLVAR